MASLEVLSSHGSSEENGLIELPILVKQLCESLKLFSKIEIENIHFGSYKGSFRYGKENVGSVWLENDSLALLANFSLSQHFATIDLQELTLKHKDTKIGAKSHISLDSLTAYTQFAINVNNDANLSLYTRSTLDTLEYRLVSHNDIRDPKRIVTLFELPQAIRYWVHDAITLKDLTLDSLTGSIDFNDLSNAYKSLHVTAKANHLSYQYHPEIAAVDTAYTDLEFKDGVLFIRPQNAYSYDFNMGKSWLKIDFTQPQELLTLILDFTAKLNDDMLHVLNTYGIRLPMQQNSGDVKTDLQLIVNLQTLGVEADGVFQTKKGNFHYLGSDIDVQDLSVQLHNYDVRIDNMLAKYQDMIDANVSVRFDAKASKGDVLIDVTKLAPSEQLRLTNLPLHVTYAIDPQQDTLAIGKTSWQYAKTPIQVDSVQAAVDLKKLSLAVPTTAFAAADIAEGLFSGNLDLKNIIGDFHIDLIHFKLSGIEIDQSNTQLDLHYAKNELSVTSDDDLYLDAADTKLIVKDFNLALKNGNIYTRTNPTVYFGNFTQGSLALYYDAALRKAKVDLYDLLLRNPNNGRTLYKRENLSFSAAIEKEELVVRSKKHGIFFTTNADRWTLQLQDIQKLYSDSAVLKTYNIDNGSITINKNASEDVTHFSASLKYPYKILMKDGKAIEDYFVVGEIDKHKNILLNINEAMKLTISDKVDIFLRNLDISLPEVTKLIDNMGNNTEDNTTTSSVEATALNANLYLGNERYALSDVTKLQFQNGVLTAQLEHRSGKAGFKIKGKSFHIYGNNFSDVFMEKLFKFTKFKDGKLDFNIDGTFDNFEGIFYVEDTRMLNYTIFNNILAFINTVPALVTFSVPGYSQEGIHINKAYMKFDYNRGLYTISDLYADSKELKISAKGTANSLEDSIDMDMTLKTDIGSSASQIPIVGYIIFDDKAVATTLKITGKLSDPQINSKIAKEVIVAPLNIIKRTIQLPFKLFE